MDYLYSPSHCWLARERDNLWRVGLTRFATRMLGDIVDHQFDLEPGQAVELGQTIGWIEGFKALSDLFCVAQGRFAGANPLLREQIQLIDKQPYGDGWLYKVDGTPDSHCTDVHGYVKLLDSTIERLLQKDAEQSE